MERAVITVSAPLWIWTGGNGSWHFITIPEEQSGEIRAHAMLAKRGFGSARVEARIARVVWRTSVFPVKEGGYFLPVKGQVRREAGIVAGDIVTVELQLL